MGLISNACERSRQAARGTSLSPSPSANFAGIERRLMKTQHSIKIERSISSVSPVGLFCPPLTLRSL
jgi:hypothetical protein